MPVDNNRVPACDIPDSNAGAEDDLPAGTDRMDTRMVEDGNIPVGNDRALDPALAADHCPPAADIEGHTGAGAELEVAGDGEPAPEMRPGWNHKVTVDFDVPFKIRALLGIIRIPFLDERGHWSLMVTVGDSDDKLVALTNRPGIRDRPSGRAFR